MPCLSPEGTHGHSLATRKSHPSLEFKPVFKTASGYMIRWTSERRISSVQLLSCVWLFATPWTSACQASLSIPTPGVYSNSCPLSWWCHPTFSSSVIPFSSHLHSFPASRSFPMSQFFTSDSQRFGVSASTAVLQMNIRDWFPLGWTVWIFLQSKGLSRAFSNTTVQKHQFFSAQRSL